MNDKKDKERPIKIEFRIDEIAKISHVERDPIDYGLSVSDLKKENMQVSVNLSIDDKKGKISFKIKAQFMHSNGKEEVDLFGIESLYRFKIKNFKQFKTDKPEDFDIPDRFMSDLFTISICGTRGMLAVLNTNPAYKNFVLPLMDPLQIVKELHSVNT